MADIGEIVLCVLAERCDEDALLDLSVAYLRQQGYRVRWNGDTTATIESKIGDSARFHWKDVFPYAFRHAVAEIRKELTEQPDN